jgi:hypothetical protein
LVLKGFHQSDRPSKIRSEVNDSAKLKGGWLEPKIGKNNQKSYKEKNETNMENPSNPCHRQPPTIK